jgi:hypothetical protein
MYGPAREMYRRRAEMGNWGAGLLGCWVLGAGVLRDWCSAELECWGTGELECWVLRIGVAGNWGTGIAGGNALRGKLGGFDAFKR